MIGLLFAGFAYLCFNAISLFLALFLANLWLPFSIDHMPWPLLPALPAATIDIGLIALFGLQHSIMARQSFKRRMNMVPLHLQRSVYVLATCIVLALLVVCWQPLPAMVWGQDDPLFAGLLWAVFGLGWLLAVASTYMIDHYELLGLSQAIHHWRGTVAPAADFRTPYMYRYVRHPLYLGLLLVFWVTPPCRSGICCLPRA